MRRLGARAADTLIVIEGIYSMLGDRAPLKDIVAVKRELGGYLLVDEAHSLGVLGERGRGLVEEQGVLADADFIVGTFSKSLGGAGGFCVSDLPALDLVRYSSRPYIFTASPSPCHDRFDAAGARHSRGRPRPPGAPARELPAPARRI